MGGQLEGGNSKGQVVPRGVLSERGQFDTAVKAPLIMHKLYEVVCAKVSKQLVTKISEVIAKGQHSTVSEVVRTALSVYLQVFDGEEPAVKE